MPDPTAEVPVAIIGGGPAGLTVALVLARYGLGSCVVERHEGLSTHPKAMGLMQRTMELFRVWGIEDAVRRQGLPPQNRETIHWRESLAGREYASATTKWMPDSPEATLSPSPPCHCPQTATEAALRTRLEAYGTARLLFGHECLDVAQDENGVSIQVRDAAGSYRTIRARYLVAADGSASPVRQSLGIAAEGPGDMGHFVNVYHEADYSALLRESHGWMYNIFGPAGGGSFLKVDTQDRWIYHSILAPGEKPDDYNEARCLDLLQRSIGSEAVAPRILSIGFWIMAAQIAQAWRSGRIFLTGDAAARTTPAGGLGMNTAIASAHNLAWKLAAVLLGWAGPRLLDTYEAERRRVAEHNVESSRSRGEAILRAIQAAEEGRWPDVEAAFREQAQEISRSRIGLDLGYSYHSEAVLPDGTPAPPRTDIGTYVPTGRPGHRAPHVWLHDRGNPISTIDLFTDRFTLLTGDRGEPWLEAARALSRDLGIPLQSLAVGPQEGYADPTERTCMAYGIDPDGAVLVRPDGFVSWRSRSAADSPADELGMALARSVCR